MSTGILRSLVVNVVANAKPLERSFTGLTSTVGGFVTKIAALTGGVFAVSEAFQGAAENDKAIARLNAVVEATGHAAGFSSQQIQDMASELQKTTTFADEVTIGAAAMLATFKEIKGDNFRDALSAAQDLSTVMGTSLQSSVVQLGKALNDPVRGITALRKSGVSFTVEQQSLIKSLMETNQVAKAQRVILDEVANQFGGASTAEAATFSGQLMQMKTAIGDVGEALAAQLQPQLIGAIEWLKELATAISSGDLSASQQNWIKLSAALAAVVFVAPKVYAAINGIQKSLVAMNKATTTANVIGQAFSGPKGWLTLLVGAGVAVGAVYAVDKLTESMESNQGAATQDTDALKANAASMQAKATSTAAAAEAEEKLLEKLKEQVATFGMTSREAEILKAKTDGVSESALAQAKALNTQLTALEAGKQAAEDFAKAQLDMQSKADAVRESLRSPMDEHKAKVEELLKLVNSGALSWADYGRAVDQANKKLIQQQDLKPHESPSAIEAGSAAAFQKIAEARGVQQAQKLQERQLKEAERHTQLLTQIASGNNMSGTQSLAVANF